MEQKKNNIFMPLLLHTLKVKKNWFFLSTVILFVTTLLVPYILGAADKSFFIYFGIFEIFVLVFVNCLVDNSFLHNDSKLAYYKSKPATFREQVSINLIINLIFTAYLLMLISLSVVIQRISNNVNIFESFKFIIPWLTSGIFLASLSSILSGNTLIAGAMTIFNFALPGIIYLIIQFMFSILENLVIGYSSSVLMGYFVNKVYKLEYIYFVEYLDKPIDCVYFLLLGIILVGITLLIFKMLKRRKNENTGSFIVFDGYKYFVSVLASLIIPAFFSIASYDRNISSVIIVSLLLAGLTYYIIIAVMEKSFRVSILSLKVFVASMIVFMAATGLTIAYANQHKDLIPDADDVKYAYIGTNQWALKYVNQYLEDDGILDSTDLMKIQDNFSITLFSDKENIQTIIDLHKEMLSNQDYSNDDYWRGHLGVMYFMKDGSFIIRDYKLEDGTSGIENKDKLASKLLSSQEFKEKKYYYLYDEKYISNKNNIIDLYIGYDGSERIAVSDKLNLEEIRPYLMKDIDEMYLDIDNSYLSLLNYNYEKPFIREREQGYYLQIVVRDDSREGKEAPMFYLNEGFTNIKEYLQPKLTELTKGL